MVTVVQRCDVLNINNGKFYHTYPCMGIYVLRQFRSHTENQILSKSRLPDVDSKLKSYSQNDMNGLNLHL